MTEIRSSSTQIQYLVSLTFWTASVGHGGPSRVSPSSLSASEATECVFSSNLLSISADFPPGNLKI